MDDQTLPSVHPTARTSDTGMGKQDTDAPGVHRPETFTLELRNVEGHFEASRLPKSAIRRPLFSPYGGVLSTSNLRVLDAISGGSLCINASEFTAVRIPRPGEGNMQLEVQTLGNGTQYQFDIFSGPTALSLQLDVAETFPHLRVRKVVGFVTWEDGQSIAGMLTGYLHNSRTLEHSAQGAPKADRKKWAKQIRETVKLLHDADILWIKAFPENVSIDCNGDA